MNAWSYIPAFEYNLRYTGEKLATCQVNHLNNHCYKIWKFNHCNYFTSVNQGIQKLENLSNSRARTSARERCSYRYWAAWSQRVTARQARQEAPTRPFPWGRPKAKGGFKSCFFQKWKERSHAKFILNFPYISCKLSYRWFRDKGQVWISFSETGHLCLQSGGVPLPGGLSPKEHMDGGISIRAQSGWFSQKSLHSFCSPWCTFIVYTTFA